MQQKDDKRLLTLIISFCEWQQIPLKDWDPTKSRHSFPVFLIFSILYISSLLSTAENASDVYLYPQGQGSLYYWEK